MRYLILFLSIILLAGCKQPDSNKSGKDSSSDTTHSNEPGKKTGTDTIQKPVINRDSIHSKLKDSLLIQVATKLLRYIKANNYQKLASSIHPRDGVRFSPYANIDTGDYKLLSPGQLMQLAKQNKPVNWGTSWDAQKPELMTIDQYFKRFVYDVDFLNAKLKSVNEDHSQGTDLNNINEIYPGCNFVEFFFPGFEEKYGGTDFRALRLVFRMENKRPLLVAIVHDEWTP